MDPSSSPSEWSYSRVWPLLISTVLCIRDKRPVLFSVANSKKRRSQDEASTLSWGCEQRSVWASARSVKGIKAIYVGIAAYDTTFLKTTASALANLLARIVLRYRNMRMNRSSILHL